jgi:hypothetical protein
MIQMEGTEFTSTCVSLGVNGTIQLGEDSAAQFRSTVRCPDLLITNPSTTSLEDSCLYPCPSFLFTDDEYSSLTLCLGIPGVVALFGNVYMLFTPYIRAVARKKAKLTGKSKSEANTFLCKGAPVAGLFYCLVEPLPALTMGTDVACECGTEDCYQTGSLCKASEMGVFALQSCLMWLTAFMIDSILSLEYRWKVHQRRKLFPAYGLASVGYPLLNLTLACFVLKSVHETDPNFQLNKVRSSFKCFPQLTDFWTEFALVNLPLILGCFVIILLIAKGSRRKIQCRFVLLSASFFLFQTKYTVCMFTFYFSVVRRNST